MPDRAGCEHGLAPKAAAVDIAKLRKAEGKDADQHIKTLGDYGKSYEEIEREKREEEAKLNSPEKTEHLRALEQRRKELEQGTDSYEHDQVHTQEGKKQFHRLRDMTRDAATLRAKIGANTLRAAQHKEIGSNNIGKADPQDRAAAQQTAATSLP